jgi:hypothetical protein
MKGSRDFTVSKRAVGARPTSASLAHARVMHRACVRLQILFDAGSLWQHASSLPSPRRARRSVMARRLARSTSRRSAIELVVRWRKRHQAGEGLRTQDFTAPYIDLFARLKVQSVRRGLPAIDADSR